MSQIYRRSIASIGMRAVNLLVPVWPVPYPRCVFEMPGGKQRWLKVSRDREVVRRFTAEGRGIKELALIFDVSQRTIQRILKRTKDESNLYSRAIKEA